MNDNIIISSISKVYFITVSILSFIFLVLCVIFILLQNGVYIEHISIPKIEVKKLYIKWNEKIDVSVDEIHIVTKTDNQNLELQYKNLNNLFNQLAFFQDWFGEVALNSVTIDDIAANFKYSSTEGGFLKASSPTFSFKSKLFFEQSLLNIKIEEFKDLKNKIAIDGNIILNSNTFNIATNLHVDINQDALFDIFINAENDKIRYRVDSLKNITDLKHIIDIFNFPNGVTYWVQDAIEMSALSVDSFSGWIDSQNISEAYKNIQIKANVADLVYTYDKQLDSVHTLTTELEFKDGILFIRPKDAYSYNFFLDKSWLKIDFSKKEELLTLHLLFKGMLNKELLGLLNRYKINLPLLQRTGSVDTNLKLEVNLRTIDVHAKGEFFTKKANIDYLGLNLDITDTFISLNNFSVNIPHMLVQYKDILNSKVNVTFNAKEHIGQVKLDINDIAFKEANLYLKKEKESLHVLYNIVPNQDILNIEPSQWMFKKHLISLDKMVIPFDLNTLKAEIPATLLEIKNIASALVSGEASLKSQKIDLDVDLLKYAYKNIELAQSNLPLKLTYDKKINIQAKEKILLNADNLELTLSNTSIEVLSDKLNILSSSFNVEDKLRSNLTGTYNFDNKDGLFYLHNTKLTDKTLGILFSHNKRLKLYLKASDYNLSLSSKELNIHYISTDKDWKINFNSLKKIAKETKILQDYNLTNGDYSLYKHRDEKNMRFSSHIRYPYKFLAKRGKLIDEYKIYGEIKSDTKDILLSINNALDVEIGKEIKIAGERVGINIDAILDFFNDREKSTDKNPTNKNITFTAKDSYLYLGENRYMIADSMHLQYFNKIINAQLKHKDGHAGFKLEENKFYLYGEKFNEQFMGSLFSLSKFKGGELNFSMSGNTKEFDGIFYIKNTIIREAKLLNNMLAFIDTIPSLLTFSLPNYNKDGLAVSDAYMNFHSKDDTLNINDVYLKSVQMEIAGRGNASFKKNSIDVKLNLKTELGSAVSKIPIVGYILLGKDTVSTTLNITGKLDDPSISTMLAQDIIVAPLNIIKRTLLLPYYLITGGKEEKE